MSIQHLMRRGLHMNMIKIHTFNPRVLKIIVSPIHKILENKVVQVNINQDEEATLRNMTEVVNAQSESLQSHDFHMSQ
ncbi:hypothetical protein HAX54_044584, partial [Datura stramonium]|nr:hypothetical protein [Datura stramonium]